MSYTATCFLDAISDDPKHMLYWVSCRCIDSVELQSANYLVPLGDTYMISKLSKPILPSMNELRASEKGRHNNGKGRASNARPKLLGSLLRAADWGYDGVTALFGLKGFFWVQSGVLITCRETSDWGLRHCLPHGLPCAPTARLFTTTTY